MLTFEGPSFPVGCAPNPGAMLVLPAVSAVRVVLATTVVGVEPGVGFWVGVGVGVELGLGDGPGVLVGVVVGVVEPLLLVVAEELFEASFVPAAPQPVINEIASSAVKPLPSRVI